MLIEYDEVNKMNRLILIGNGFDLAHRFKTSYKDFIFDYLFNHINELNWVDIENEYFELLVNINQPSNSNTINTDKIKKINLEFDYLKNKLEEYLIGLKIHQHRFSQSSFKSTFLQSIKKEEVVTVKLENDIEPNSIYFLNFNYTDTINNYFDSIGYKIGYENITHNFIHGELESIENPIIFGFGDELNEKYKVFENQKNNELFTHIKSFKYSQTSNYHDLIRFIESDMFQVFVIGHSCGLSDRTMLNQIFEHENCKSVKIFYHKRADETDDFTEKTYEISRHFKNKGLMRKKLVPKDKCQQLPKPRKL